MARDSHPLQIFLTHQRLARRGEGPRDVSVFSNERFLFGSYDNGREQILDVRAHGRLEMLVIFLDWLHAKPARPPVERRSPADPKRATPRSGSPAITAQPPRPIV